MAKTGRVLFGIAFLILGSLHFIESEPLLPWVPDFLPGGLFWVYATGVAMCAGGLALITGQMAREAAIALALLMGSFILTVYVPLFFKGAPLRNVLQPLCKDLALMGGALAIFATKE